MGMNYEKVNDWILAEGSFDSACLGIVINLVYYMKVRQGMRQTITTERI